MSMPSPVPSGSRFRSDLVVDPENGSQPTRLLTANFQFGRGLPLARTALAQEEVAEPANVRYLCESALVCQHPDWTKTESAQDGRLDATSSAYPVRSVGRRKLHPTLPSLADQNSNRREVSRMRAGRVPLAAPTLLVMSEAGFKLALYAPLVIQPLNSG